jgi:Kef-type K+ transport system membrane component KefB
MSHLLQLLLVVSVIVTAAKLAGWLSQRFNQPAVFGEILIGLILGPSALNILGWQVFAVPDAAAIAQGASDSLHSPLFQTIHDLAEIGVILLMFMAGLETDMKEMKRVGKVAFWAAVGGVIGPLVFGFFSSEIFRNLGLHFTFYESIFIGTILTATSVSISAQTLIELGHLKSKEGTTILGAAVIDDVIGIIILSFVIAFKPAGEGAVESPENLVGHIMAALTGSGAVPEPSAGIFRIAILIILMIGFFIASIMIGRKVFQPVLRWAYESPISQGVLAAAIVLGLLYAWSAEFIGSVAAITGSYIAGILVAQTDYHEAVEQRLHAVTYSLLVPIFFISIGLKADIRHIFAPLLDVFRGVAITKVEMLILVFTVFIVIIAIITKVLGCMAGGKFAGFSWGESYRVGVGMISRGEVGLIVASVGLASGIINTEVFSIMVLMVLVTTLVTPIWLKKAFRKPKGTETINAIGAP